MSKAGLKPLLGLKTAILAANGFHEADLTAAQRALAQAGANMRIVSVEQGLVNSWSGGGWGHHFAVDTSLNTALASDYAFLIIPGGAKSVEKLKLTAHTRRFINSFLAAGKPVAVFDDALRIMIYTDNVKGYTLSGPPDLKEMALMAGASWADQAICLDKALLTGLTFEDSCRRSFVEKMMDFFISSARMEIAA